MASFEYLAVGDDGRTRTGVLAAANEDEARGALARRSLAPVRLVVAAETAKPSVLSRLGGGRIGPGPLALVTRQLATLALVAPLEEALRTIALQTERASTKRILLATHSSLLEGQRLSEAMGRQGAAFPPLYRAMIAAGETSGSLPQILARLAVLLEREQDARAKTMTATIYPAALAATATLVVIALMTFVVPKVVDQFDSMGQTLPFLTRAIIFLSDLLRHWGWLAAIVLCLATLAFGRAMRREDFRLKVDARILALPLIGRLIRNMTAARLARTLSTMIAGGLPVMEGLRLTARTIGNRVMRAAVEEMASQIREGASVSGAMRRTNAFPPILVHMTASGESAGRLEPMLESAAEYLERETNAVMDVALSLLEPAIIIAMGAVVATIVLSILLPILQINTLSL